MLESAARVQPHASLGVLISKEEAVLRARAQTLDLRQLFSKILARVNYRGLKYKRYVKIPESKMVRSE